MLELLVYATASAITLALPGLYFRARQKHSSRAGEQLSAAIAAGLVEPPSLHPVINRSLCIGCGTCVTACPEEGILGLVDGKSTLIAPSQCIGHGACKSACPMDAIELVFGTATRGIDIPHVNPNFETNVPGLYIAGELGGMGLIRNAITQGQMAMEQIAQSLQGQSHPQLDVIIVGAGPAGIAATLQAVKSGLRYVALDQSPDIGGTILHYPRQKLVMTQPMEIPLFGKYKRREIQKEELLELFGSIVRDSQVKVQFGEKVQSIVRAEDGFRLQTDRAAYSAPRVLLAIGRRGSPRKLGVPGEDSDKVSYVLLEPEQYAHKEVLVVGGGDSAAEAALALSKVPGTGVTISYRKPVFSRLKEKNRLKLDEAQKQQSMVFLLESTVKTIGNDFVELQLNGNSVRLKNDYVLVFAGGEPPTKFLNEAGVRVETKYGAV